MSLLERRCKPCEGTTSAYDAAEAAGMLKQINERWQLDDAAKTIRAGFDFKNYYQTTAFVNAVAWIAHKEDHHPEISFGYRHCDVTYSTHAIGGLTENDFICAAKIDALVQ